jgi:hypothetical protein
VKQIGSFYEQYRKIESIYQELINKIDQKQELKTEQKTLSSQIEQVTNNSSKKTQLKASRKSLDTAKLAQTLRNILKKHKISQCLFAREILEIDQCFMGRLINHPIPWNECPGFKQRLYRKIKHWCRSIDAIRSLAAISDRIHRQK